MKVSRAANAETTLRMHDQFSDVWNWVLQRHILLQLKDDVKP